MNDDNSTGLTGNTDGTTQPAAFFNRRQTSASDVNIYLRYVLLGVGICGIASNALVLYAWVVHRQESKKRGIHLLIMNQNLLDLCCSIVMVITISLKVTTINLTGTLGYILCAFFISDNSLLCLRHASVTNLMTLTVERYLKVVYPYWSKKNLKTWMIYAAIVFCWIAGILPVFLIGMLTSFVVKGRCPPFTVYWRNLGLVTGLGTWTFVSFYLLPLITFVFCYGHIVVVMRKQMRVMAGHNVEGSAHNASQAQSKRISWNITKTMIIVSAVFIACYSPWNLYLMLTAVVHIRLTGGYIAGFFPYINVALNPFIYATRYEGVRRVLVRMIKCRKHVAVGVVTGSATN